MLNVTGKTLADASRYSPKSLEKLHGKIVPELEKTAAYKDILGLDAVTPEFLKAVEQQTLRRYQQEINGYLYPTGTLEKSKLKDEEARTQRAGLDELDVDDAAHGRHMATCITAYEELSNPANAANSAKLQKDVDEAEEEVKKDLKKKDLAKNDPGGQLQAKFDAYKAWKATCAEAEAALPALTPRELIEQAEAVAKDAKAKQTDSLESKMDGLATAQSAFDQKLSARNANPAAQSTSTETDPKKIEEAEKKMRNKTLAWTLGGAGLVVIGLIAGLLILASKLSHLKAQEHQVLGLLMQAQNPSPDQSQGGPQSPYAASQNGFGGYGPPPPYTQAAR